MITYANKLSDEMVWKGHQSLFFTSVLQAICLILTLKLENDYNQLKKKDNRFRHHFVFFWADFLLSSKMNFYDKYWRHEQKLSGLS